MATTVKIYKGDVVLSEIHSGDYNIVTKPKLEMLLAHPLNGKLTTKIIDASICSDKDFIKAAIERSIYPLIIIFPDGKLPFKKAEFKTKNKVEMLEGSLKEVKNLFALLDMVILERDRNKVYEALKASSSLHHITFLYLYDNIASYPYNEGILSFVDMVALHKDAQRLCELLAFSFRPPYRKVYFKYLRPKKEE